MYGREAGSLSELYNLFIVFGVIYSITPYLFHVAVFARSS